jgi:hypothetical protein
LRWVFLLFDHFAAKDIPIAISRYIPEYPAYIPMHENFAFPLEKLVIPFEKA